MSHKPQDDELEPAMGRDPLTADEEMLARTLYGRSVPPAVVPDEAPAEKPRKRRRSRSKKKKAPTHYKVVSISLYTEDIEAIDRMVAELKAAGHTRANRSALIRYAIHNVDLSEMPRNF